MLKIYQVLFELFQYDTFDLSVKVESDIEVFLDILEGVAHECTADIEREKEKKVSDKLGKSVALSSKKMQRKYLEGGGKRLSRNDGGDCTVKACPKCGLDMFNKESDNDANKRENTEINTMWIETRTQLAEYLGGEREDPPTNPKSGKAITSEAQMGGNPNLKPLLLRCHIGENYESVHIGGSKCRFKCKIGGKQYAIGRCPACLSSCSFVWNRLKHKDHLEYFELVKMRKGTTRSEREAANEYLERVSRLGETVENDVLESLKELRDEGELDATDLEVQAVAKEQAYYAMAQNITHNGPSQTEQTFFQRMLTRADHPNGAGWSNATNTNMRQPNAHQRARNTRLSDTAAARGDSGEGYDDDIAEAVRRSVADMGDDIAKAMRRSVADIGGTFVEDNNSFSMESFQSNNSQNYCNLPYSKYPSNKTYQQPTI
jgi:hypothetical protein